MAKFKRPMTPRRGFRGYPVGTVAFYGPDDTRATKVAVGVVPAEDAEPTEIERWFNDERDVRADAAIGKAILDFLASHGVRSVALTGGIIGCPHEEGWTTRRDRPARGARSGKGGTGGPDGAHEEWEAGQTVSGALAPVFGPGP